MSDIIVRLDQTEDILTCEISDEALETAAAKENEIAGRYTLAYCTYLQLCPGP
jgi:hypothetical protein